MAIDMNALRAKAMQKKAEKPPEFIPIDLNEGNVQAIFNRCLATEDTPEEQVSRSILFSRTLGYRPEDEIVFYFDKEKLLENKKNIYDRYGQLNHTWNRAGDIALGSTRVTYSGTNWTGNNTCLWELLYLGCTNEIDLLSPFNNEVFKKFCKDDDDDAYWKNLCAPSDKDTACLVVEKLTPTLSPKDPAFPAWWEQHKSEWEA